MVAERISIDNAKKEKLFYFVANAVVYRESDGRCLILKRHTREKVHPGKYAVPGGKLEWNDLDIKNPTRLNGDVLDFEDAIEELLKREVKEEAGIEIGTGLVYINNVVFVRPDETPVILVKFGAKYKSGEVKLEEWSFTDHAWVNAEEAKGYDCIEGIKEEIAQTIKAFSGSKNGK
jgi:8-oxo-dGTP pyrophosphatase MutT (NUDIX family)